MTPNQGGAANWPPPSYNPDTGLYYVSASRAFSVWYIYDPSDNLLPHGERRRKECPAVPVRRRKRERRSKLDREHVLDAIRANGHDPFFLQAAEKLDQQEGITLHPLGLPQELLIGVRSEDVGGNLFDCCALQRT